MSTAIWRASSDWRKSRKAAAAFLFLALAGIPKAVTALAAAEPESAFPPGKAIQPASSPSASLMEAEYQLPEGKNRASPLQKRLSAVEPSRASASEEK